MTTTYKQFSPESLVKMQVVVNHITRSGYGLAVNEDNEMVYIPPRYVATLNANVGDLLNIYASDNHADPSMSHHPTRWRAVRAHMHEKLESVLGTEIEEPNDDRSVLQRDMLELLKNNPPMTLAQINKAMLTVPNYAKMGDALATAIYSAATALYNRSDIVIVKIYSDASSHGPTSIYYTEAGDKIIDHLETPMEE